MWCVEDFLLYLYEIHEYFLYNGFDTKKKHNETIKEIDVCKHYCKNGHFDGFTIIGVKSLAFFE